MKKEELLDKIEKKYPGIFSEIGEKVITKKDDIEKASKEIVKELLDQNE